MSDTFSEIERNDSIQNCTNTKIQEKKAAKSSKNSISWSGILFEIRNITGNPFIHIFGIAFPIFLSILISKTITIDLSDETIIKQVCTTVFLGIGYIIPMATILMGYAATYSQEIEKGIDLRMHLFGFSNKSILLNRMIAEIIILSVAFILYCIVGSIFIPIKLPSASGICIYLLCLYGYSAIMFMLAHSIAALLKKFGITYALTMALYFLMMILGGEMGITYDRMPKAMQVIAKLLPLNYISQDGYTIWTGESYNYVPMIQSFLFLAAVSGILLFIATYKNRRKIH